MDGSCGIRDFCWDFQFSDDEQNEESVLRME
jgi:hypothetical protein